MTLNTWLEQHRALLHAPPGAPAWADLLAHWDAAPPTLEEHVWLDQAAHALNTWPDDLRTAPTRWIEAALDGLRLPGMSLARRARLYPSIWLGRARFQSLTDAALLKTLTTLDLSHNILGAEGAEALAKAPWTGALRALLLSSNTIGGGGAESIARAEALAALEHLDLGDNAIGVRGATALQRATFAGALRALDLGGNNLGVRGARRIGRAPFSALTSLDLSTNQLTDDALEALTAAPWLARLRALALDYNQLGAEGARRLASALGPDLESLRLHHNDLPPASLRPLLRQPRFSALRVLDARGNSLDARDLDPLPDAPWLASLQRLTLGSNRIDDQGLRLLASAHLPHLTYLDLSANRVTDVGVAALAKAPWADRLEDLDLNLNDLHAEGARALTQAPWFARLDTLNLSNNRRLGDEGAEALASTPFTRLRILGLSQCGITTRGARALLDAPWLRRVSLIFGLNPAAEDPGTVAALKARAALCAT